MYIDQLKDLLRFSVPKKVAGMFAESIQVFETLMFRCCKYIFAFFTVSYLQACNFSSDQLISSFFNLSFTIQNCEKFTCNVTWLEQRWLATTTWLEEKWLGYNTGKLLQSHPFCLFASIVCVSSESRSEDISSGEETCYRRSGSNWRDCTRFVVKANSLQES